MSALLCGLEVCALRFSTLWTLLVIDFYEIV